MSICIAAFFVYQEKIDQPIPINEFSYNIKFENSVNDFIRLINQKIVPSRKKLNPFLISLVRVCV